MPVFIQRPLRLTLLAAWLTCTIAYSADDGFVSIFDGKTLKGWHASGRSGHSKASQNQSGGRWVVEEGAIVGTQDIPGNGGILITDEQYGDFEISLETNNDFGPDSGIFLRSTEDGKAYQAHVDYHAGGTLMGVYLEGLGGLGLRNFTFQSNVTEIVLVDKTPTLCPIKPEAWPKFWHHGQWNELRARILGNPPAITTWINGEKWFEWTDTQKRLPDKGGIGLQVHGGKDFTKQFVRYRNIKVKTLN